MAATGVECSGKGQRLATASFLLGMEKWREEEEQKPSQLAFPHQSRQEVLAAMS